MTFTSLVRCVWCLSNTYLSESTRFFNPFQKKMRANRGSWGRPLSSAPARRGKNRLTCARQSHMEAGLLFQEQPELIHPFIEIVFSIARV
jgi:hypothetical protein